MLFLVSFFSATSLSQAQQQIQLRKIEVIGLKRLSPEHVIATSGLQLGQTVNPDILDAAGDKLMQSGLFKKLSYRLRSVRDEATVTFEVEEAIRNLPVVFENFVWFTDDEIARAIRQDVPFFDGTSPEAGTTSDKIAGALRRLLNTKKIPGQVEFLPYADLATGKRELLFTVKGVNIPVCSLHFPGASAISEAELIKASQTLLKSDYSKKDIGGFARYTLFPLYRRIGHLRAEFQPPTVSTEVVSPSQCADGVAVTIPVNEGVVYSWNDAEWNGNQALSAEELTAALGMKAGEVADGFKIDKGMKNLQKAYGRRGYIAAKIKESIEFDQASSRVSYRCSVIEGPRYFMGNLIINGLPAEDAERLRAKWTLGANAVFNESYLDDFRQTGLREFVTDLMQRSRGASRGKIEMDTRPDPQKQTVDVTITFK